MTLLEKLKQQAQQAMRTAVVQEADALADALQDAAAELAQKN